MAKFYEDKINFQYGLEYEFDYVVGTTSIIEEFFPDKIFEKIKEYNKDELINKKTYERLDAWFSKDKGANDMFLLNVALLRILDQLIYIDNERNSGFYDEYKVEDEQKIKIRNCDIMINKILDDTEEEKAKIDKALDEFFALQEAKYKGEL